MSIRYLLDTNVISEPLKTRPNKYLLKMLQQHQHEIATAAPVWHELQFGCWRLPVSKKREMLHFFLSNVVKAGISILPYDETAASWHAAERARLSNAGKTPSFVDGQIAAIAHVNALILVTRNTSDFTSFSELKVQNWHR
ncbi:MAG: type II toxin-antitoxin system VapC family toxin [Desulfobacteraceae bacterium]|nr:type II toxin-antitoxin system VapC family toxin [Desulfobacteraceae bacterium]